MILFSKLKSLPALAIDFLYVTAIGIYIGAKLGLKHRRKPTEEEAWEASWPLLKKTYIFQQEAENFEHLIGMVAIAWATIESTIDLINALLITRAGGDEISAYLPQSLQLKLSLFRKSFDALGVLSSFKERALTHHSELQDLKEFRHDLIHGVATEPLMDGIREICRHSYRGAQLLPKLKKYDIPEIIEKYIRMKYLQSALLDLLTKIDAALPKDVIDNSSG